MRMGIMEEWLFNHLIRRKRHEEIFTGSRKNESPKGFLRQRTFQFKSGFCFDDYCEEPQDCRTHELRGLQGDKPNNLHNYVPYLYYYCNSMMKIIANYTQCLNWLSLSLHKHWPIWNSVKTYLLYHNILDYAKFTI